MDVGPDGGPLRDEALARDVLRRLEARLGTRGLRRHPLRGFAVRRFAGTRQHAEGLDGLRVAHLTDLHVGRVTPIAVQFAAVEIVNAHRPDLVVVTGDFVCHSQLYLDELSAVVEAIEAPVVAVLGNHDYWSGAREVRWALRRAGAEVLDNQHTVLEPRPGQRIQIVGLDDAYTGHADWHRATRGLRHDLPSLGLSHIAEEAEALWHTGVSLVLAGHTHAGQVTLARLHEVAIGRIAGHKYVHGLYGCRETAGRGRAVYVGAGVGAAVVPLRLGVRGRREVTLFELGTEPGTLPEPLTAQEPLPGRPPRPSTRYRRHVRVVAKEMKRGKRRRGRGVRSLLSGHHEPVEPSLRDGGARTTSQQRGRVVSEHDDLTVRRTTRR